mmetsp:Transcript_94680/g.294500  ORF Transcript_94680/g.294500 Transcript_94680/m.294500 type:complete len:111 (+) Transcript_94680:1263-1595(+)
MGCGISELSAIPSVPPNRSHGLENCELCPEAVPTVEAWAVEGGNALAGVPSWQLDSGFRATLLLVPVLLVRSCSQFACGRGESERQPALAPANTSSVQQLPTLPSGTHAL